MESIAYTIQQYYKYQAKKLNTNKFCRLKKFEMIAQLENTSKVQPNEKQDKLQNIEKFTYYKCSVCNKLIQDFQYEVHTKKHQKFRTRIQAQEERKRIKNTKRKRKRKALKMPVRGNMYLASQVSKNKSRLNKHKKKTSVVKQKNPDLQITQPKQKKIKKAVRSTQLKKLQNQPKNKKNKLPTNIKPQNKSLKQQQNIHINSSLGMVPENIQNPSYGAIQQYNQQIKCSSNNFNQQYKINAQLQNNASQNNQHYSQSSDRSLSQISQQNTQKQQTQQKIFSLTNKQGQTIAQFRYKLFTPQRYKTIQEQNYKLKKQIQAKDEQLQKYKRLLQQQQQYILNLHSHSSFVSNSDTNNNSKPYTNTFPIPQQNKQIYNNLQNINIDNKLQNQIYEQKLQQKKKSNNHTTKKDRLRMQNHIIKQW